jgi:hypothetical protein
MWLEAAKQEVKRLFDYYKTTLSHTAANARLEAVGDVLTRSEWKHLTYQLEKYAATLS